MTINRSTTRLSSLAMRWRLIVGAVIGIVLSLSVGVVAWIATTIYLSPADVTAGTSPTTLAFPVQRSGDLDFDVDLTFHTRDVTARAGIEYAPTQGTVRLPAGATSTSIPVNIAPSSGPGDKYFYLVIDHVSAVVSDPGQAGSRFVEQPNVSTTKRSQVLKAVDLNLDDRPDLVTLGDEGLEFFLNHTEPNALSASFSSACDSTPCSGASAAGLAIADFNNDGRSDVAASSGNHLFILSNRTDVRSNDLRFDPVPLGAECPTGFKDLQTADLNGDGRPDLVALCGGEAAILLMNVTEGIADIPVFNDHQFVTDPLIWASGEISLAVADMDGNGSQDLVVLYSDWVPDRSSAWLLVYHNTTPVRSLYATFEEENGYLAPQGLNLLWLAFPVSELDRYWPNSLRILGGRVTTADLDGNGKLDVIINTVLQYSSNPYQSTPSPGKVALALVGFGGIGYHDCYECLQVQRSIGFGSLFTGSLTSDDPGDIVVADVDLDGKVEVIYRQPGEIANDRPLVLVDRFTPTARVNTGQGFIHYRNYLAQLQVELANTSPGPMVTADVNDDGKVDLIVGTNDGYHNPSFGFTVFMNDPGAQLARVDLVSPAATGTIHSFSATALNSLSFTPVTGAELSSLVTSDPIVMSGLGGPGRIAVSGGTYTINHGPRKRSPGVVRDGDHITVTVRSARVHSTTKTAVLSVGEVSAAFSVTTKPGRSRSVDVGP